MWHHSCHGISCKWWRKISSLFINAYSLIGTVIWKRRYSYSSYTWKWKDPKIIFTTEGLTQRGIEVTTDWDGYGLLKATPTHDVPIDTVTYNFAHLTIQEFLCALYMSILVDRDQEHLLSKHFKDYPNVFIFLCGLTRLVSPATSQFVYKMLQDYPTAS